MIIYSYNRNGNKHKPFSCIIFLSLVSIATTIVSNVSIVWLLSPLAKMATKYGVFSEPTYIGIGDRYGKKDLDPQGHDLNLKSTRKRTGKVSGNLPCKEISTSLNKNVFHET